jgi:hypothetical protein
LQELSFSELGQISLESTRKDLIAVYAALHERAKEAEYQGKTGASSMNARTN